MWDVYWRGVGKNSPEVVGWFKASWKEFPLLSPFLLPFFPLLSLPLLTSLPLRCPHLFSFGCWGSHGGFAGRKECSAGAPWLWTQQKWFCDCIRSWWHPFLLKFLAVKARLQPIRRQGLPGSDSSWVAQMIPDSKNLNYVAWLSTLDYWAVSLLSLCGFGPEKGARFGHIHPQTQQLCNCKQKGPNWMHNQGIFNIRQVEPRGS